MWCIIVLDVAGFTFWYVGSLLQGIQFAAFPRNVLDLREQEYLHYLYSDTESYSIHWGHVIHTDHPNALLVQALLSIRGIIYFFKKFIPFYDLS